MIVMLPIPDAEGDITLIGFSVTEGHIFCYFLLEKRNKCYVTLKKKSKSIYELIYSINNFFTYLNKTF